jgi:hypothetical protein
VARDGLPVAFIDWVTAGPAIQAGVTPQVGDCAALWAIAWRARSAAWMARHRSLLENALT